MPASDFTIYQEQFHSGFNEAVDQHINLFNEQSAGAMVLRSEMLKGDFASRAYYKKISGLISRRDTTSTADVTAKQLQQGEFTNVKVNRKIGPVDQTFDAWKKIASDPQEMSFIVGQQAAQEVIADMANTGIRAVASALNGVADVKYDGSTGTLAHKGLLQTMAKLGDASNQIVAWVMHSKTWFDLMDQAITDNIWNVGGTIIFGGTAPTFNRPTIVTDANDLLITGIPDTYDVLGLTAGAVEVIESEGRSIVAETVTGKENLVGRVQGELAFNVEVRGFAWNEGVGGANPTDAALATSTNWTQAATSHKHLAGVIGRFQ